MNPTYSLKGLFMITWCYFPYGNLTNKTNLQKLPWVFLHIACLVIYGYEVMAVKQPL